jgi:hypothetical protein
MTPEHTMANNYPTNFEKSMLHQVKLTALRALRGSYGSVQEGGAFTTDNRTAEALMARGMVERYRESTPDIEVRVKMLAQPENKMLSVEEDKDTADTPDKPRKRGWPKGKQRKAPW